MVYGCHDWSGTGADMRKLATLAVLWGALGAPSAQAAELVRTDTRASVAPADLPRALSRSAVLARLDPGEALGSPLGNVSASDPATLYLAASSEFLSLAILRGALTLDGTPGQAGDVFVRPVAGRAVERFTFDARALAAATAPVLSAEEASGLETLRAAQADALFWGGLERTGFNAQAPAGDPLAEAVRRDYLLHPAVIAARSAAAGDPERLAAEAAGRFVAALAARDTAGVEALLSPTLFTTEGLDQVVWLDARRAMARDLVAGDLPAALAGASPGAGSLDGGFPVSVAGEPWVVRVRGFDSMVFVTALEPRAAEAAP